MENILACRRILGRFQLLLLVHFLAAEVGLWKHTNNQRERGEVKNARLFLLVFLAAQILGFASVNKAVATDSDGFVYGVGTSFAITNSPYLNITLSSTEVVRVLLRSGSGIASLIVESNSSAVSTVLTFEGLEADKTYSKFQDGCYIADVTTDAEGRYACTQDISEAHHIVIQEGQSTITIKADGTVSPPTAPISVVGNVYTFTANIYETLSVQKNDIVVNGNGHTLQGTGYDGIALYSNSNVTVRNVVVRGFWMGAITVWNSHNMQIRDNDVSDSDTGILLFNSDSNNITGNTVRTNSVGIGIVWSSNLNIISCNTIADQSLAGVWPLYQCGGNLFYHNNFVDNAMQVYNPGEVNAWDNGYPSGGNYWSDYTGTDADGDGIGDTPYVINSWNVDHYPFMMEDGWVTPQECIQEEVQVIECWELDDGVKRSLTSKLEAASDLLDRGNINGAIHKLQDLITKVENDAKHLTEEQKDYVIVTTEGIITRI